MSTALLPRPEARPADRHGRDLHHYTCCDDDIAMCGLDVSDHPYVDGAGDNLCLVCEDIHQTGAPCPVPGCPGGERA